MAGDGDEATRLVAFPAKFLPSFPTSPRGFLYYRRMPSANDNPVPASPPRKVLLIRPTALGDVARTVPVLVSLRRAWPNARIDWLVNDSFADVVRHHPALTGIVPFPRKRFSAAFTRPAGLREMVQWAQRLRTERYDVVFDLQGLARSGFFTWLTRAEQRIGFADARELGWLGYNRRYRAPANLHTVDHMLALVAAHGITPQHDMRLYVGPDDAQWCDTYLREQHIGEAPYAVIAPTARWLCKCWPIERYGDTMQQLLDDGRINHLLVLASPDEQKQIAPLRQRFADQPAVAFPATRVGQLMALLSRAALVLCNDSAALHIAVGFDRPVVALFGPTDPAKVGPYRRDDAVIQPDNIQPDDMADYRARGNDQSLISRITVDTVWRKIASTLASSHS